MVIMGLLVGCGGNTASTKTPEELTQLYSDAITNNGATERFAKNLWWLNNLDLIASYGSQGNAVETVSPYLIAKDGGVNEYYNAYLLNISSLPYPDLGWEKTKTYNFGVDAALLDGRLNFTVNYFKKISDVLSSRNIPRENGMENAVVDGGEMTNTGYDFVITIKYRWRYC